MLSCSVSLVPSITVEVARAPLPTLSAPADAWVTAIVWLPSVTDGSDANVEKPMACPPVASRIAEFEVSGAAVLAKTLAERTLPAVASWSTVNERFPVDVPVPADTVTAFGFDEVAVNACHAVGDESARAAACSVVASASICEYESS
jgi:hypothetical protein